VNTITAREIGGTIGSQSPGRPEGVLASLSARVESRKSARPRAAAMAVLMDLWLAAVAARQNDSQELRYAAPTRQRS
jgi:hypothetical protein